MDILSVFCDIDDFCLLFEPLWKRRLLSSGERQRDRSTRLCLLEVMTIIVMFHTSSYRNFKAYYAEQVMKHYAGAFPRLISYQRFVELMPRALVPSCGYLQTRKGECSGISFIDSTSLKVCHNRRIHSHKVFASCARRGKTSVDRFVILLLQLVLASCQVPSRQPDDPAVTQTRIAVGKTPNSVAIADFNSDGQPDIAVANAGDNTITILLGDGKGKFVEAKGSPFPAGNSPNDICVADFNAHGKLDLALANP